MPVVQEAGKVTLFGGIQGAFSNNVWQTTDGTNWSEQSTDAPFSPRLTAGTEFNGQMWVIGGEGTRDISAKSVRNDLWRSSDGLNWSRVTVTGPIFSARDGHAVAVFNNKLWVIGGWDDTASTGRLWVIGGDNGGAGLAEVWTSTDGVTWTQQSPAGTGFPGRTRHATATLNGRLYVLGGASAAAIWGPAPYNDVWSTSDGVNWRADTTSAAFPARSMFAMFVHNNELWLSGGFAAGLYNDVWRSSDAVNWRVAFSDELAVP